MKEIIVYCDGGARNNGKENNVGGWGVVILRGEEQTELFGGEVNTTNNKMELTAAIRALESTATTNVPIKIYADSSYLINGISDWIHGWIKRGWLKSDKKPVENKELWMRLNELRNRQFSVGFYKVKGHSGNKGNELADQLANRGMDEIQQRF